MKKHLWVVVPVFLLCIAGCSSARDYTQNPFELIPKEALSTRLTIQAIDITGLETRAEHFGDEWAAEEVRASFADGMDDFFYYAEEPLDIIITRGINVRSRYLEQDFSVLSGTFDPAKVESYIKDAGYSAVEHDFSDYWVDDDGYACAVIEQNLFLYEDEEDLKTCFTAMEQDASLFTADPAVAALVDANSEWVLMDYDAGSSYSPDRMITVCPGENKPDIIASIIPEDYEDAVKEVEDMNNNIDETKGQFSAYGIGDLEISIDEEYGIAYLHFFDVTDVSGLFESFL